MFRYALRAPPKRYYTISSRTEFTLEPVDIGLAFSVQLAPAGSLDRLASGGA